MAAQEKPTLAGEYSGTIDSLPIRLHLKVDAAGTVTGTLDSPNQGAIGILCADFHLDGKSLAFTVPELRGSWKGVITADGLTGVLDRDSPQPLNFARDTFVPAAKPSPVDGIWLGTLYSEGMPLHVQLHVKSDGAGREYCSSDFLDQRLMDIECGNVTFSGNDFSFDVPLVNGHWAGKLSADGSALPGDWNHGNPSPLNFTRQSAELTAAQIRSPSYDPAIAPVSVADLQSVLEKDLAEALRSGELAPATGAGVSIGVVEHGVRRVFSFGAAKPDSIFEIASISKTFTGLILSQFVVQGKVKLNDPVRELLPPGTVAKPAGDEITLLDLATHHSGLPGSPDNVKPADPTEPYADYGAANLYEFLAKQGVAKPANPHFLYSNLGFGLLGHALGVHSGLSYPALLRQQVTQPLGLKDTAVSLTSEQQARFIPGHYSDHHPARAWSFGALAGAGSVHSTASDILAYLEANLHPEAFKAAAGPSAASTLSAALIQQHELRADGWPGSRIALAWFYETESGDFWHDGKSPGFSSYAFFNSKKDYAAVVLFNTTVGVQGSFAIRLGEHIAERLAGKPAISLGELLIKND
jgi:CubicO group peptidase (beta-lactamase class C family)